MNERLKNASIIIEQERRRLLDLDTVVDPVEFAVAFHIARHSPTEPVSLRTLCHEFGLDERAAKDLVRTLRTVWLLPIGSSRSSNNGRTGYFFCIELEEFKFFLRQFLRQPLDELATARNLAARHYPEFAGQLSLPTFKNENQQNEEVTNGCS